MRPPPGASRSLTGKLTVGLVAMLTALPACSSKLESEGLAPPPASPSRPEPESPPDAGAPLAGDEPDAASTPGAMPVALGQQCGLPPLRPLQLSVRDIMSPAVTEVDGVEVTFKHCPGQSFALPPEGLTVWISAGAATFVRFDAPGYLPWIEGEVTIPEGAAPISIGATMVPTAIAPTLLPPWKAELPLIFVEVRKGRTEAGEACRSPSGVKLNVKGHPGAVVFYRNKGANAGYNTGGSLTSDEGMAFITQLPAIVPSVEIEALKPGCEYVTAYGDANSAALIPILRAPLAEGAITHQVINPAR